MRKYFLDNIRWISILLLFPYHTCMIYNNWGENFYVKSSGVSILSAFIQGTSPWFMPLLFVIAGISSNYALKKRTPKEFINERRAKLLNPLLYGILFLVPIQTFFAEKFHNGYTGNYFYQYILFFTKSTDLSGYTGGFTPAHLWFIFYLFIISLLAIPIVTKYDKSIIKTNVSNSSIITLIPLFIFPLAMSSILDIGGKSVGEFFILFLFGYVILSEDSIQEKLENNRFILFISFIILTTLNLLIIYLWKANIGIFHDILIRIIAWIGILGIIGMGKHYLNFSNNTTKYFSKASFPIYIFHQSYVILVGYYSLKIFSSTFTQVIFIILGSFILTMITYEVFRRVSLLRNMFGIKKVAAPLR